MSQAKEFKPNDERNNITKLDVVSLTLIIFSISAEIVLILIYQYVTGAKDNSVMNFLFDNGILCNIVRNIRDYISTTITFVTTLVVTIVSISLSVAKETIYGLTISQFRKLDLKAKYSLTKIIILTVVAVVLTFVFYCVNLTLPLLVVNLFAVIYTIVYVNQEVPILARSTKRLHKIVSDATNYYVNEQLSSKDGNDTKLWCKDLYTALEYLSYHEGLETTYKTLFSDTKDNRLVKINLITDCYEKSLEFHSSKSESINITSTIDDAIDAIWFYFSVTKILDYSSKGDTPYDNGGIVNLLFWTIDMVESNHLTEEYDFKIGMILLHNFFPCTDSEKFDAYCWNNYLYSLSNRVLIESYSRQDTWYFKWIQKLIDYSYIDNHDLDTNYLIFISLFVYSIPLDDYSISFKGQITRLMYNERWVSQISDDLKSLCNSTNMLQELLNTLNFVLTNWYDCKNLFSKNFDNGKQFIGIPDYSYVISWFINLFLTFEELFDSSTDFINIILASHLDKKITNLLKKVTSESWDNEDNISRQKRIYSEYFSLFEITFDEAQQGTKLTYLYDFANYIEQERQKSQNINIKKECKDFVNKINILLKSFSFYDKRIKFSKGNKKQELSYIFNSCDFNRAYNHLTNDDKLQKDLIFKAIYNYLSRDVRFSSFSYLRATANLIASEILHNHFNEDGSILFSMEGHTFTLKSFRLKAKLEEKSCKISQYETEEADVILDMCNLDFRSHIYHDYDTGKDYQTRQELIEAIGPNLFRFDLCFCVVYTCTIESN